MTEAVITPTQGMTLEEFVRRSHEEGRFELIDGEILPKMPTVLGHGSLIDTLAWLLNTLIRTHQLGKLFIEAPYVTQYDSHWVKGCLVPDLMFVSAARYDAYRAQDPDWANKPLLLVPDLVVEVVSTNDSYPALENKVRRYLAEGVRMVWLVDPQNQTVAVRRSGSSVQTYYDGTTVIDGGDVLPHLTLTPQAIFTA